MTFYDALTALALDALARDAQLCAGRPAGAPEEVRAGRRDGCPPRGQDRRRRAAASLTPGPSPKNGRGG